MEEGSECPIEGNVVPKPDGNDPEGPPVSNIKKGTQSPTCAPECHVEPDSHMKTTEITDESPGAPKNTATLPSTDLENLVSGEGSHTEVEPGAVSSQSVHSTPSESVVGPAMRALVLDMLLDRLGNLSQDEEDTTPNESVLQKAPWFLALNVLTCEELANKASTVHRYKPTSVLLDVESEEHEVVPHHIHESMFQDLRNTVNSCIPNSIDSESRVIIRCPDDYGHFFLDAVVDLLAKDIGVDIIRLDAQNLADLGREVADTNLGSTLGALPYFYQPVNVGYTEPDPYMNLSDREMTRCNKHLKQLFEEVLNSSSFKRLSVQASTDEGASLPAPKVIVHIRDFKEMSSSRYGRKILEILQEVVNDRRAHNLPTLFLGNHCSGKVVPAFISSWNNPGVWNLNGEESLEKAQLVDITPPGSGNQRAVLANDHPRWNMDLNIRRLKSALRARPDKIRSAAISEHLFHWNIDESMDIFRKALEDSLWTRPRVEGIIRSACGAQAQEQLELADISNAILTKRSSSEMNALLAQSLGGASSTANQQDSPSEASSTDIDEIIAQIESDGTDIEKDLARGIVKKGAFNVHFSDVLVRQNIKDAFSGLIELSIRRPQAYTYGVLKGNRIPGVLLYGPSGTGKTYFAKAVATEAGCNTLEVSGAQVLQRYVGESEKIIQVIFQLARKLQPCVVFLDEADSVFTRRSGSTNSWERTMVNQFLHEWDIMASSTQSTFIIVATNRPQDIDEAIHRRLPRRFHLELPNAKERLAILEHYLVGERHPQIDLREIANITQRYYGSDLKNLCIAAASAAVEEEMNRPSTTPPGAPKPTRILKVEHFAYALQVIRPCVTETMLRDLRAFQLKYDVGVVVEEGRVRRVLNQIRAQQLKIMGKLAIQG